MSDSNKNERQRRQWSAAEKARIVRRHLQERVSLADLADEYQVAPGQINGWCKQALEGLESLFAQTAQREEKAVLRELVAKGARISQLQEVITELSEEVLRLKKANGATSQATTFRPR